MKILNNVALAAYTSLQAGGTAETLVEIEEGDDLASVIKSGQFKAPLWVLGFGTNVLISDKGLPGTVIINKVGGIEKLDENSYKVASGQNWDQFVGHLTDDGLWGLEFSSGIPGGSGAAVAGNIAAYGQQVADCLKEATLLNTETGETEIWPNDKFGFEYRKSNLQKLENQHLVVLDATFQLSSQPTMELQYQSAMAVAKDLGINPDSLANRRAVIIEARRRAGSLLEPGSGIGTAGSFFKNPIVTAEQAEELTEFEEAPGKTKAQLLKQNQIHGQNANRVSAAHILLAAGFKRGQSWGQIRLHPEHILKIENTGNATASEIYSVVQEIVSTVKEKSGIILEPEVRFLGDF